MDIKLFLAYLWIGVVWALIHEPLPSYGTRFRFMFFWPFTMVAWIFGFINALLGNNNDDEEM